MQKSEISVWDLVYQFTVNARLALRGAQVTF